MRVISKIDSKLAPREYCVQVLHAVLQAPPERDAETLQVLPDAVLQRLVRAFAASRPGLNEPLPPHRQVFASFKRAVRTYLHEEEQRLRQAFEDLRVSLDGAMTPIKQQLASTVLPSVTADLTRFNLDLITTLQGLASPPLRLPEFQPIVPSAVFSSLSRSITGMVDTIAGLPTSPVADMARYVAALQQSTYWAEQSRGYLADIACVAASGSLSAQLASLFTSASDMSLKFGAYFDDVRAAVAIRPGTRLALETDIVAPSRTSAIALGTVKVIGHRVGGGEEEVPSPQVRTGPDHLHSHIDTYLSRVQPRLISLWHGAWQALLSHNPDRLRQAAHSGREVLSQILHELAPDSAFSPDELKGCKDGRPSRKMRVARVFGTNTDSSKVALIESQARLADEVYAILSAVAHAHDVIDEAEVAGYLMSLDGVLLILLSQVVREKQHEGQF